MMNIETMKMREEIKNHLTEGIIPFWKGMRDDEFGGYYGYLDYDLNQDKKAEKGCILNTRITWYISNAYTLLKGKARIRFPERLLSGQRIRRNLLVLKLRRNTEGYYKAYVQSGILHLCTILLL